MTRKPRAGMRGEGTAGDDPQPLEWTEDLRDAVRLSDSSAGRHLASRCGRPLLRRRQRVWAVGAESLQERR